MSATDTSAPESRPAVLAEARDIATRIRQLRGRHGRVALGTGIAMLLTALAVWLGGECVTDFLVNLTWFTRLLCFLAGVGPALAVLILFGIRPWRRRLGDEAVALMVERALPVFRSRFIAAVQLAQAREESASPALVKALVAETTALAAKEDFSAVIDNTLFRRWRKIAFFALLIAIALGAGGRDKTWPLVRRALLSHRPVPRKTLIRSLTAPQVIAIGEPWRVAATAGGIVPAGGRLVLKTASGLRQEFDLLPEGGVPPVFARTLQSVQESFTFHIALGDAESDEAGVKVKTRPAVMGIECRLIFPAYTRLPERRRALGDLRLLAGSRLALNVQVNAGVKSGEIRLVGADHKKTIRTVPLTPDAKDSTRLTGQIAIPPEDAAGLTLRLVDQDGVTSQGGAIYPVEILPDAPPTIQILWPERREELLTRDATMLLSFAAKDDYGVARVRLNYAVDWFEGAPHQSIDLDVGDGLPRETTRQFRWRIAQIQPRVEEGRVIDYWFEVFDANDITGPGIGHTEHYQARIVSSAEKRADLANRLSDAMEGLNGVKQGEEELNDHLGEIIFAKPAPKPQE
jgi:hypothetical protein